MELKKKYNQNFVKRSEIMRNTQFKTEDIFGEVMNKDNISQDQIIKPNNFSGEMM